MNEPINILIHGLDDKPEELELMKKELAKFGFTNIKTYSSDDLFKKEFHKGVHMTILDYILGEGKTGIDILDFIEEVNPNCYNIVMSAFADPETVIEFGHHGASDFVSKNSMNYLRELVVAIKRGVPRIQKWLKSEQEWEAFEKKWRPNIEQH